MSDGKKHHKWSASKWPAFVSCPHFSSSDKTSKAAELGTLQHSLLEARGTGNDDEYERLTGLLKPDEIESVEFVYDEVMRIIKPGDQILWEEKISTMGSDWTIIPGTADVLIVRDDSVHLIDAKFGIVKDYDPQLQVYSLGALQKYKKEHCEFSIIYGRERYITHGLVSKGPTQKWFDDQLAIIKETEADKKSHPMEQNDSCQYCSSKGNCPAIKADFLEIKKYKAPEGSGIDQNDVKTLLKGVSKRTNFEKVDIDTLGNLLTFFKMVEKHADHLKSVMKNRIDSGEECITYKLQQRAGSLRLTSATGLYNELQNKVEGGVSAEDFIGAGTYSLGRVRELLYGDGASKKANKEEFETEFSQLLVRGSGSSAVVKRSTKEVEKMIESIKPMNEITKEGEVQ